VTGKVNTSVARAVANIAIFLEFSGEELLDADAAVGVMEQLAADLQSLDGYAQRQLSTAISLIASEYGAKEKEFLVGLPEKLGLEEET